MKTLSRLIPLLAAAGCTQAAADKPIPGAAMNDGAGATAMPLIAQHLRPCGYTLAYDTVDNGQSTAHSDWTAVITYDAAGRDIAEQAVDGTGAVVMHDATAYDAMGNFVTFSDEQIDAPKYTASAVYDSAGRMIRYAGDDTGAGAEDWVATYEYGRDHERISAHLVFPSTTYDRAYHYDALGRLVQLDKDIGPDGVVDQITAYAYDDAARIETRTTTSAAGQVIGNGTTSYDDDNHVLAVEDTLTAGGTTSDTTDVHAYAGGREISDTFGTKYIRTSDHAVSSTSNELVWRYDHCQ